MTKARHLILGIHITDRLQQGAAVQQVLMEFAEYTKTRLGLHDIADEKSAGTGVVLIEFIGSESSFDEFSQKLNGIEGVEAKTLIFDHQ